MKTQRFYQTKVYNHQNDGRLSYGGKYRGFYTFYLLDKGGFKTYSESEVSQITELENK